MPPLPPTSESRVGSRVVFLIDESESLRECIAGGTKSKAESIATALNSLLNQLVAVADLEVAVAGYRGDPNGGADVGCRWGGPLSGRRFVPTTALADSPLVVENRVRRIAAPTPGKPEETVRFPVWYVPQLGGSIFPGLGYAYCRHLVVAGTTPEMVWSKPPVVISFLGDLVPREGDTAVERVRALSSPGGPPLVFHVHLGGTAAGRPVLYPSSDVHLPKGSPRDLFSSSSVLPDYMIAVLRDAKVPVSMGARGMIYNASVADLIRMLSLVKAYAQEGSSRAAPVGNAYAPISASATKADGTGTVPPTLADGTATMQARRPAPAATALLLVLVADRGVANPADAASQKNWLRLQDQANDLLTQVARRAHDRPLEVAVLTFSAAPDGSAELRSFDGPLAGRQVVAPADLAAGAARVVEFTETMSNGIGGLITVDRKRSIYVDQPAAAAGPAAAAFAAVDRLATSWRQSHPGCPVVVLHLGGGLFDAETALPAFDALCRSGTILYHLVLTESPHRSLAYPATPAKIDDPLVGELWQRSSPLLAAPRLADEKRVASANARGIVINGRFDLLLEGILDILQPEARS